MSSSVVDWALLGRVVLASVLAGVGLVVIFSLGLVGLSLARDRDRRQLTRVSSVALVVVTGALVLGALVGGFVIVTNKG